ncbi:MAG: NUDIX domain-containing protein [Proteobacteria bacterium]|nr:NUDIX domain-containing protein [Pseudomonadota bacterium]
MIVFIYSKNVAASMNAMRRLLEPAVRRVLHFYWRFARGLTLGVRALVVDGEARVFLVRHTYVDGWHLPGGGVEPGETLAQALARELLEEGNIELAAPPPMLGFYYNARISRRDHVAVYLVREFRQRGPLAANREIAAGGFFHIDGLPPDTGKGTRARIAEALGGAPVSAEW